MKKVWLITTGGTIASRRNDASGDVTAQMTGGQLKAMLHDPLDGISVEIDEFMTIGSFALTLDDIFGLCRRIAFRLAEDDCAGVVVTHGTDTMEESAYMADLLVGGEKPVVFTGAQRAADEADADGPRNIADAVRLAASTEARGLGTTILFEQEFHAARDVTKTHTARVDTFMSGEHGKLGEIDGERIIVHRRPIIRATIAAERLETDIEIVKLGLGTSDRYLRFVASQPVSAVVLEGFGRGNAPPAVTEAAIALVRAGMPVVMTSRCPRGRVKPVYGNGGGKTLADGGILFAGDLSAQKARILMSVLLGAGLSGDELRQELAGFSG